MKTKSWAVIGWAGLLSAVLIMAFYTDVAGWVFAYVFKSIGAALGGPALGPDTFGVLAGGTWEPLLWQLGVLCLTSAIIAAGVSKGIERVTKALIPPRTSMPLSNIASGSPFLIATRSTGRGAAWAKDRGSKNAVADTPRPAFMNDRRFIEAPDAT